MTVFWAGLMLGKRERITRINIRVLALPAYGFERVADGIIIQQNAKIVVEGNAGHAGQAHERDAQHGLCIRVGEGGGRTIG